MPAEKNKVLITPKQQGRDDSTRQKLLDAGLEVFADMGYEAATTRIISQKAKVNLAAIPYYFGTKENLYNAVVQFISDTIAEHFQQEIKKVDELLSNKDASREALLGGLELVLRAYARLVIESPAISGFGPIIMREQLHPSSAFNRLFEGGIGRGHLAACRLVARLMGRPEGDSEAIIQAHALMGQILIFRAARELALRRLQLNTFSQEQVEAILKVIIQNCRKIFQLKSR